MSSKTNIGLIRFCNIYRPPYSSTHRCTLTQFLKEFDSYMNSLVFKPGYLCLTGDFNIHIERKKQFLHHEIYKSF